MKLNNNYILKLAIGLAIIIIIRTLGLERIPFVVIVTILSCTSIYFIWSIFTIRVRKKERTAYRIFATCISLFAITSAIAYTIQIKYPQYLIIIKPILLPVLIIQFVSTGISVWIWVIIRENNTK